MNGFTDVRLFLKQQELNEPGVPVEVPAREAPPGLSRWGLWRHRWATRKQLLQLTPLELRDLGLSERQQREEGLKPFWRR